MEYLEKRLINEKTKNFFQLEEVTKGNEKYIKIPLQNGFKYRLARKPLKGEEKYILEGEDELFNINRLNIIEDDLYICIGEFNAMILWQLGYKNVVSIPKTDIKTLRNILNKNYNKIKCLNIIFVRNNDMYSKQIKLLLEKQFKDMKTVDIKKYKAYKDINELLFTSENVVHDLISSAITSISIMNLSAVNYKELMAKEKRNIVNTGINFLNNVLNGFQSGRVYGIVAPTGHGKTTLTVQTILNILSSIENKVLIVNGEESIQDNIKNIYMPIIQRLPDYSKNKNNYITSEVNGFIEEENINIEVMEKLQLWHKNRLYLFNSNYAEEKTETDKLFDNVEKAVINDGITHIVIDNIMSLNHDTKREAQESQYNFVSRCQGLAKKYNVCVFICMHMKKFDDVTKVDYNHVYGSSNISNLLDALVLLYRSTEEEKIEKGIDGHIKILKNRIRGVLKSTELILHKGLFLENDFKDITDLTSAKVSIKPETEEDIKNLETLEEMENYLIDWNN